MLIIGNEPVDFFYPDATISNKVFFVNHLNFIISAALRKMCRFEVNILTQRARLWVTPVRGYFAVEWIKHEIRISKSETNPKFE
jgi:hypothetical protein